MSKALNRGNCTSVRIFHDSRCIKYGRAGHAERPERIVRTVSFLKKRHPQSIWIKPISASREELLRAHSEKHLERVANQQIDFDPDCPAYPDIFEHAARSAGAAIQAARAARKGEPTFSLMRPPGHHALRDHPMGFCYFGNVALAALDAAAQGVSRIAIWDFDAHHGNGTEAIVKNTDNIIFASIHQYPGWPGTGTRSFANIHNFPVLPFSPRLDHVARVRQGLDQLLAFEPQLLLISAGFDAYVSDPITQMTLERDDFATFGEWLAGIDIPTAAMLEGGYSDDLPELIDAFLTAWTRSGSVARSPTE